MYADLDEPDRARRAWTDAVNLFTAAVGAEDDANRARQRIADLDE